MIHIELDWSDLEEGMQRALRERNALVAHALAVAQSRTGGGIVGRLEALERERCELQTKLAVWMESRARQKETDTHARRQSRDRIRITQWGVGLLGLLPAGLVLTAGLLGMLLTAPLELLGLYFTEGRDLGRFMGWPAAVTGLGGAAFLLSLAVIVWLGLRMHRAESRENDSGRGLKARLEQVLAELGGARMAVETAIQSDVQQLLPADAPQVDVFALWAQRLRGERRRRHTLHETSEGDAGVDRLVQALDRVLPRGVIALRGLSPGPGLTIDLILIGNGRVWLLQCNAQAGTMRHVNGVWTRNTSAAARSESTILDTWDTARDLEEAQRAVVATLNRAFLRSGSQGPILVQSGIVFTHPEARLLGLGDTPINYGDVSWWANRLDREFGAAGRNRWPPDRLTFRIADALLADHARVKQVRQYPSPGVVSSIFEEQWVALETWAGARSPSATDSP